jgi:CMP-N-acetylneuraminic acid synthetase
MEILITICARGGSKGIPGKNIKQLHGIPLIYYTINAATQFSSFYKCDIGLSTDNEEIKGVAELYGILTEYIRPANLATDHAGKIEVIHDLLNYEEKTHQKTYDFIIDLDITSPLRTIEDIRKSLLKLEENPDAYNIFSVSQARRNPYFNMIELENSGYCRLIKNEIMYKSRQEAPEVFELNASFYIYRRKFFTEDKQSAITDKSLIWVMQHICFDLDHPIDFEFLTYLIENKKLDFIW